MNLKLGLGVATTAALAVAGFAPAASARSVSADHVQPTISQSYTCSTPVGNVSLSGTITGKATVKGKTISLKKVVYAIQNSVGFDLVVDHVQVWTPDPSKQDAKYKKGSAKVPKKSTGWKAGHDSSGVFAAYSKSMTIKNGDNVTTAPLSAKYTAKGQAGTEIDFHPGPVIFHVSSPISGDVSCTPDEPVGTFASVTL